MKLERCTAGHYYDANKFVECPHCAGEQEVVSFVESDHKTTVRGNGAWQKQQSYSPVGGWLVCICGVMQGVDYPLKECRNQIGVGNGKFAPDDEQPAHYISILPEAQDTYIAFAECTYRKEGASAQYTLRACGSDLVLLDREPLAEGEERILQPEQQISIGDLTFVYIPFPNRSYW